MLALWMMFCRNLTQRFQRRLSLFLSLIRATKVSTPRITRPERQMQKRTTEFHFKKQKPNETLSLDQRGELIYQQRDWGGKEGKRGGSQLLPRSPFLKHNTSESPFSFHDLLPNHSALRATLSERYAAFATESTYKIRPCFSYPLPPTCWQATSWQLSVAWHSLVPLGLRALLSAAWHSLVPHGLSAFPPEPSSLGRGAREQPCASCFTTEPWGATVCKLLQPAFPFRGAKPALRAFFRYDILSLTTAFDEAPTFSQWDPAFSFRRVATRPSTMCLGATVCKLLHTRAPGAIVYKLLQPGCSANLVNRRVRLQDWRLTVWSEETFAPRPPYCSQLPNSGSTRHLLCRSKTTHHTHDTVRDAGRSAQRTTAEKPEVASRRRMVSWTL